MNQLKFLVLVFGILVASAASANMKLSLVAGGNYGLSGSTTVLTYTLKPAVGYQAGLALSFPIGVMSQLSLGGIYTVTRILTTDSSGVLADSTSSSNSLVIPGTIHFALGHAIGLNMGGWYSMGLGTISGISDYGAEGGLRFHLSPGLSMDANYEMGLKDNGSATKSSAATVNFVFDLAK